MVLMTGLLRNKTFEALAEPFCQGRSLQPELMQQFETAEFGIVLDCGEANGDIAAAVGDSRVSLDDGMAFAHYHRAVVSIVGADAVGRDDA